MLHAVTDVSPAPGYPAGTPVITGTATPNVIERRREEGRVEPWWEDRPVELWVARRLHDYSHLPHKKGEGVRPWILRGRSRGAVPTTNRDDVEPVGWVDERVIEEAERAVGRQTGSWGPRRRGAER